MRLRPYLLAPLALALSGCGHMPVSTMWALRGFDAATADPASLRAAIRIPESLEPRPGGVTLEVGWWRDGDEANKRDAKFVLQEIDRRDGIAGRREKAGHADLRLPGQSRRLRGDSRHAGGSPG